LFKREFSPDEEYRFNFARNCFIQARYLPVLLLAVASVSAFLHGLFLLGQNEISVGEIVAYIRLIGLVALGFRRIARLSSQRAQRSLARVNLNMQEAINGIAVAKSFRQKAAMNGGFRFVNQQYYQVSVRQGFVFNGIFPILITITNLGTTIEVHFGSLEVMGGLVSAGDWFLFVQSIAVF